MANLNDVLQGLVNLNSKMANNINSMLDSIGEGFLDVGEISFNGNTVTLSNAVVLVNGSNKQVPNLSATFTGNQICFLEFKANKSFALKLVNVTDANFNYNSSSLTSTSKHFAVARRYGSVIEDVRVIGMVSDDKTIVGALNGALKAIDLDNSADLELNLDALSRISALETNKVDRTYVTNYVSTAIKDKIEKSYVDDNFVSKTDNNFVSKTDNNLATTDKTIVGAINEVFQRGNNVKQLLVDALIAKDVTASTDESFESLIGKISEIQGGSGGTPITSYATITVNSSDLVLNGDYYYYSIESFDWDNITLILADVKAIDDDIGFTQYYTNILYPPERFAGKYTFFVGNFNGNGGTSVYEGSSWDSIPIMKSTDNFSNGTLTIFYKAGTVSNSRGLTSLSQETTQYRSVDYNTIDLNSIPGKFDYIIFDFYAHTVDADGCNMTVIYDCNSKKCCYMIRGYYKYCYQFDNVPSNLIPILRSDLSSIEQVYYTGFIANNGTIG